MAQRMGCRETRRCYTGAITCAPSAQRPRGGGVTMQQVTVRVPASTSNLGPGYDCLGVALRLYNSVTLVRGNTPRSSHPRIVSDAAERFFKQTRRRAFSFSCSVVERVPRCRGLGSSATVRLGILLGLNRLSGEPLDRLTLFRLCAESEGHPDNAAPAALAASLWCRVTASSRLFRGGKRGRMRYRSALRRRVALIFRSPRPGPRNRNRSRAKNFAFKDLARCCGRKLCERMCDYRGICIAGLRKNAWHFFRSPSPAISRETDSFSSACDRGRGEGRRARRLS